VGATPKKIIIMLRVKKVKRGRWSMQANLWGWSPYSLIIEDGTSPMLNKFSTTTISCIAKSISARTKHAGWFFHFQSAKGALLVHLCRTNLTPSLTWLIIQS
jgi:hypothetical protein